MRKRYSIPLGFILVLVGLAVVVFLVPSIGQIINVMEWEASTKYYRDVGADTFTDPYGKTCAMSQMKPVVSNGQIIDVCDFSKPVKVADPIPFKSKEELREIYQFPDDAIYVKTNEGVGAISFECNQFRQNIQYEIGLYETYYDELYNSPKYDTLEKLNNAVYRLDTILEYERFQDCQLYVPQFYQDWVEQKENENS